MAVRPRHVRHRIFSRLRHSKRFLSWLDDQATALGVSAEVIFNEMLVGLGMTYQQVEVSSAPSNTTAPSISGTTTEGETLSADPGVYDGYPAPTFEYQWLRDDVEISGAQDQTYVLVAADVGANITVEVTATNPVGEDIAVSAAVGPVVAA